MPHPLIESLMAQAPVVTDGGWGTQMQARGLPSGACPDEWNLSHPDEVEAVARSYVESGSQIVLTNTFGGNRIILERHGLADKAAAINRAGAELSRRAADGKAKVFGSMGPTGVMLMMGERSEDELRSAFEEQAQALAEGGADGIVVETMADATEALLAATAAKTTGLPVVACMTYDSGKDRDRTMMGITPEQAAEALAQAGVDAIGANCGQGIEGYIGICGRLKAAADLPVWIKANAGLPELVDGQAVYSQTAEEFAAKVPELVEAGATFIGGCCGTSPDFITAICRTLGR